MSCREAASRRAGAPPWREGRGKSQSKSYGICAPAQRLIVEIHQRSLWQVLWVVKLADAEGLWRIRVGDYRIVYQVREQLLQVLVVLVGHRGDVYRRLRDL